MQTPISDKMFVATDEVAKYLSAKIKDLFVPTDLGAFWRFAFLPPWGFFYKQRTYWGYGWSGVLGASFLSASVMTVDFMVKRDKYNNYQPEKVTTPTGETALLNPALAAQTFSDLAAKTDSARINALNSVYVFLGLYTISLAQAYFIKADTGNIQIAMEKNSFHFAFYPRAPLNEYGNFISHSSQAIPSMDGWEIKFWYYY